MIYRGSDSPVPWWWWKQSSRDSICNTAHSPPPGALALLSSSALSLIHRGAWGRKLFVSFYVSLCWREAFKAWFRLRAMWKLECMWVRAQCSSLKTQSGPSVVHSHSFRLWIKGSSLCSTATDLKEKWGHKCRPLAHAPQYRKSCSTAFFIYSPLNVVRTFKKYMRPDSCCCIIKGSVHHGKQTEHCPIVWSLTINSRNIKEIIQIKQT